MNNMESSKGEIVMYQLNDVVELDVRLEDETVWLTQQQMSELFSVKENTVTYHIKEIYKTEELEKEGTARKIRVVRKEGNRNVRRTIDYYNLDMIISVGYKVNSKRGVKFRQWATQVLKDHLLKGYSVNKSLQEVKTQLGTQDKRISLLEDKVDFFVRSSLPPVEGVFYCQRNHDRFLIIDDMVYLFGASLKDAGKKLFAYIKMQETSASELLNNIR